MNAYELSTLSSGDWISYDDIPVKVVQVDEEDGTVVATRTGTVSEVFTYEEVEPIPITPKILKKNGFKGGHWYESNPVYSWKDEKKGFLIQVFFNRHEDFQKIQVHKNNTILYLFEGNVHDLQDTLRECKSQKEIIL